jgi:hypothetical protein
VLLAASGGGPDPSSPSVLSASPEGMLGPWQGVIARARSRELPPGRGRALSAAGDPVTG